VKSVLVVGAGPAGLMAAQVLTRAGVAVTVADAMPSAGRKFLLAGKGGLNLTHSETIDRFMTRYGTRQGALGPILQHFDAQSVRDWAASLGEPTFVGSSGRVFPVSMKAAPLLRAWLHALRHPAQGVPVQFLMRHRWCGWATGQNSPTQLLFQSPKGDTVLQADAVVLALGGGSWRRLGSDGTWVPWLRQQGIDVADLLPANCGFDVVNGWSDFFRDRFAGQPFKSVAIRVLSGHDVVFERRGEFVATSTGVEGSLIYAASSLLRDALRARGVASFTLDLLPDRPAAWVLEQVAYPRGSRSLSSHLKSRLHLDGIKSALLHELLTPAQLHDSEQLAAAIKALPIQLQATRPLDEAISSAGGVCFEALDDALMVRRLPGVFCAGEMLDWEAPTGGYLLTACLATGAHAARGVLKFLQER